MWRRFAALLRCPICSSPVRLDPFRSARMKISPAHLERAAQMGIRDSGFDDAIEAGVLACDQCRVRYPIFRSVPCLLPYATPLHAEFQEAFAAEMARSDRNYTTPNLPPVSGEEAVAESFSREWLEYDFDGVLWTSTYDEHEKIFLAEVGLDPAEKQGSSCLEIGCGLGIVTHIAQRRFGGDAVGVDLSLAPFRAAAAFRDNPFLHFVQASVFHLPFGSEAFDIVFSRGVLHHTCSTRLALLAAARHCRVGGRMYVWVYGPGSIRESVPRRLAYAVETRLRPVLSRRPSSIFARVVLSSISLGYMAASAARRLGNPAIQAYTFQRALHGARDRFTPGMPTGSRSTKCAAGSTKPVSVKILRSTGAPSRRPSRTTTGGTWGFWGTKQNRRRRPWGWRRRQKSPALGYKGLTARRGRSRPWTR